MSLCSLATKHCYKNSISDGMLKCLALVGQLSVCWSSRNCSVAVLVNWVGSTAGRRLLAGGRTEDWRTTVLLAGVSCDGFCDETAPETTTCDLFLFESCDNS